MMKDYLGPICFGLAVVAFLSLLFGPLFWPLNTTGEVKSVEFVGYANEGNSSRSYTVVEFVGGRKYKFAGHPSQPIPIGKSVSICYNRTDHIYCVHELD